MVENEFTIMTDVNTDVEPSYAEAEGIVIMPQYYHFNDGVIYGDEIKLDSASFYKRLYDGEKAMSMGCNPARIKELFEAELNKGKDILAIIFSSELSGSYNTACTVAKELESIYPERKIIVMDSLNASAGAGLMVYMARDMQKAGKGIEEIRDYIESIKSKFQAMFVVDDLQYLVRGGRLSPLSGKVGTALDIKPILHLVEGKIQVLKKKRTRKKAVDELMDVMKGMEPDHTYFVVVHTHNRQSAVELVERIKAETGIEVDKIIEINHTIGTHTGPNALGFGFLAGKP